MKKSKLDMIVVTLIILNFVAIANTAIFADKLYRITNVFDYIIVGLFMYTIFVIPIAIVVGIILNIISSIKKKKIRKKNWINIVYILVLVLTIPFWYEFFNLALMSI